MFKPRNLILSAFFALSPHALFAEPTAEVQRLIGEPASMFDIGLLRTEKYLENAAIGQGYDEAPSVDYDLKRNLIEIRYFKTLQHSDLNNWRASCQAALADAVGSVERGMFGPFLLPFSHRGWSTTRDSDESGTYKALRGITEVGLRVRLVLMGTYVRGCKTAIEMADESGLHAITFEELPPKQ